MSAVLIGWWWWWWNTGRIREGEKHKLDTSALMCAIVPQGCFRIFCSTMRCFITHSVDGVCKPSPITKLPYRTILPQNIMPPYATLAALKIKTNRKKIECLAAFFATSETKKKVHRATLSFSLLARWKTSMSAQVFAIVCAGWWCFFGDRWYV